MTRPKLVCALCEETPTECNYEAFCLPRQSVDDYVWENEGTLDKKTGKFLCDMCYVELGCPSSPTGWTATPENMKALNQ